MPIPTKEQIVQALGVLRDALSNKFGDDAAGASSGEGCNLDVRCGGIDLIDSECALLIEDGEPAEIADELLSN